MSHTQLDYSLASSWDGGFVLEIFVTNLSDAALDGYSLSFDLDAEISDFWGADTLGTDGQRHVVSDDSVLGAGDVARFKFKALGDITRMPENLSVDGDVPELTANAVALTETYRPPDLLGDDYAFVDNAITVDDSIDAATLNALIAAAPDDSTIHLAAGDYRFDESLAVNRSDVSLIGAGSAHTRLTFTDAALRENTENALRVSGNTDTAVTTLAHDVTQGDTSLSLTDADSLKVGDVIRLSQDNDDAFLDAIGDTQWRESDSPLRTSMARIVAIDGDNVTLDRGVHFDLAAGDTQVDRVDAVSNVTLSGFDIGFTLGETDPGDFSNTHSNLSRYHALELSETIGASVEDISVTDGPSIAFEFGYSLDISASNLVADGSFNKGSGGNGYAFELRGSFDGQFDDLADTGMRHGLLFASWHSSVGNDITVRSTDRDINFHGGRDHDNTVHVAQSVRVADNDEMSTTTWINRGESFGAPTDEASNPITFDYAVGSRRDDVIHAGDDGAYLDGSLGNDVLIGGRGDDILLGGGGGWGENRLEGGAMSDVAVFDGELADYTLDARSGDEWQIEGNGTDYSLVGIERALFADGQLMDLASGEISQTGANGSVSPEAFWAHRDESSGSGSNLSASFEANRLVETADDTPLHATFDVVSRWSSGYVMGVTITNDGDVDLPRDTLTLDLPSPIHTLYGATLLEQTGDTHRIHSDYTTLAAGESMRISFKAYSDISDIPTTITLGDRAVTIDESSLPGGNRTPGALIDEDRYLTADDGGALVGGSGDDHLVGSDEDDLFSAGMGSDVLTGAGGSDRFVWQASMESTSLSADTITDFDDNDTIDLSALDADFTQSGRQSFEWQADERFTGDAGQLRFDGNQLQGDTTGDGIPNLVIELAGVEQLDASQLTLL